MNFPSLMRPALAAAGLVIATVPMANASLPSSTDWQAWNAYVSAESHPKSVNPANTLPSSTDWQAWNDYIRKPGSKPEPASRSIPSSTDWEAWNEYFTRPTATN